MASYQVISRRYRPQTFASVVGQQATVTTLKNAIKSGRLAHAYLFCGARGTGKTTLARLFAKALNCYNLSDDGEPCCSCPSCIEIAATTSLDVLEIDGASHRGIEDVRQINETVVYTAASGRYKIYIIDEVHMLTKEAFNALLKTLEEPPPKVKFLFATTEPHKLPTTILSRCQRFNLQRIDTSLIIGKLTAICESLALNADASALHILARRADGSLRDAESLLDQTLAFSNGVTLTAPIVSDLLGLMPRDILFTLDRAGRDGDLAAAFTVSEQLFTGGKDLGHFVEMLVEHIRTLLLVKISGVEAPSLLLTPEERVSYLESSSYYSVEQCMTLLDMLVESQNLLKTAPVPRFALEALLLRLLRSHRRIPLDLLVQRLAALETQAQTQALNQPQPQIPSLSPSPPQLLPPAPPQEPVAAPSPSPPLEPPTPTPPPPQTATTSSIPQHRYDTLLQFAAVELEGSLQHKKRR